MPMCVCPSVCVCPHRLLEVDLIVEDRDGFDFHQGVRGGVHGEQRGVERGHRPAHTHTHTYTHTVRKTRIHTQLVSKMKVLSNAILCVCACASYWVSLCVCV